MKQTTLTINVTDLHNLNAKQIISVDTFNSFYFERFAKVDNVLLYSLVNKAIENLLHEYENIFDFGDNTIVHVFSEENTLVVDIFDEYDKFATTLNVENFFN